MRISVVLLLCFLFTNCKKDKSPQYPIEPIIEFISIDQDTVSQGILKFVEIIIGFTDGDKDLFNDNEFTIAVYEDIRFNPPLLTENLVTLNSLEEDEEKGEATIRILYECCVYPDFISCEPLDQFPLDTLKMDLHLIDNAGHISNTISKSIIILCD